MSVIRPMGLTIDFRRGWRRALWWRGGVAIELEVELLRLGAQGPYFDLFWNWLWEEGEVAGNVVPVQT